MLLGKTLHCNDVIFLSRGMALQAQCFGTCPNLMWMITVEECPHLEAYRFRVGSRI